MHNSTFKYVGTLVRYIQASLHTQFVAGGAQVGRVEQGEILCQKADFQKLLHGTINLPYLMVFALILGTFW